MDYNENYSLRMIANEVFGEMCFTGEIYWESKTKSQNTSTAYNKLQPKAEMIFVYSKQPKRRFNLIGVGNKEYPCQDKQGEYREYPLEVMNATGVRGRESMIFDVSDGVSTVCPPAGKQWKLGQAQVATYLVTGNLFIREGKVIIKMRPEFERSETTEPFWGLFGKEMGTAESAKKELNDLLEKHGFETVKPVEIIKRLIYHSTNQNDIVLDFFSGSATTAHAVMQLNAERMTSLDPESDKLGGGGGAGGLRFIMVQLPEVCDPKSEAAMAGYKNICEIGKERIRRAGKKIKADSPLTTTDLDVGFRVLKLDSTNMEDVYYNPNHVKQDQLIEQVNNIKPDREPGDLLFQVMLDLGILLSSKITQETIGKTKIYRVADGYLIACFDAKITETVVTEIAKKRPPFAVFRDSSFDKDSTAINFEQIFKTYSPTTKIRKL